MLLLLALVLPRHRRVALVQQLELFARAMLPEQQIQVMLLLLLLPEQQKAVLELVFLQLLPEDQEEVLQHLLLPEHDERAPLAGSPSHQTHPGSQAGRHRPQSWRHSVLQTCSGSQLKKADVKGQKQTSKKILENY